MIVTLDSIFSREADLCRDIAQEVEVAPTIRRLVAHVIGGAALYGFSMGLRHSFLQALVSALKVPALFFLTLVVCLPALHFVGLLFGSRIKFAQSVEVLLVGLAINSILLSAFAPISLFFLASGSQYDFLLLMHVAVFGFCGAAGLRSTRRNFVAIRGLTSDTRSGGAILWVWMLLYMFVGTQMAYSIAPFVGRDTEFLLFRYPDENFYTYVLGVLSHMLR